MNFHRHIFLSGYNFWHTLPLAGGVAGRSPSRDSRNLTLHLFSSKINLFQQGLMSCFAFKTTTFAAPNVFVFSGCLDHQTGCADSRRLLTVLTVPTIHTMASLKSVGAGDLCFFPVVTKYATGATRTRTRTPRPSGGRDWGAG